MTTYAPAGEHDVAEGPSSSTPALRLPVTPRGRYSLTSLAATTLSVVGLLPGMPSGLSAAALIVFVALGPGCAALAWLPDPTISRLYLVPALGLAVVVIVTAAAATLSWWSPHGLFAMIALATAWSVIPNLRDLVRDMVP